MIKKLLLFVALCSVIVTAAKVDTEEKYSDKYDHINVDEILKNEQLRSIYYKCFLDTGPCKTADARFFKGIVFIYYFFYNFLQSLEIIFNRILFWNKTLIFISKLTLN